MLNFLLVCVSGTHFCLTKNKMSMDLNVKKTKSLFKVILVNYFFKSKH